MEKTTLQIAYGNFIKANDNARKVTLAVNEELRAYYQNSKAGQKFSFDFRRYLVSKKQYRNQLWLLAENLEQQYLTIKTA